MTAGVLTLALAAGFALQPTGTFHANEPVARDGEAWLALEETAGGARLVSTRVRLARVHDPLVDAESEATGLEVTASASPDGGMLLRGDGLRPGPVETAERLDESMLPPGEFAAFRFRGVEYRVRARCPESPPPADGGQACDIVLAGPAAEQALFSLLRWRTAEGGIAFGDDASPHLIHAGDLDRDGRVDLILDSADHSNASEPTLYLSAPAARGEALRHVASHRSVGC